jgi:O-antigen/teichoic acid export membrane protein
MGIVLKQSAYNTLVLFLGFAVGGINILFLYTHFLHEDYFGLITFLLSTANILLPLMVFGMHHTVIKYFSVYDDSRERDGFLIGTLVWPLLVIVPIGIIGMLAYEQLASWLSAENPIIYDYTWLIFLVALFQGYFEIFYAWSKVQLRSVFGNFIKELFARVVVALLLIAVFLGWISDSEFVYAVVAVFGLRMLIMLGYAVYLYRPKWVLKWPKNYKEVLKFSGYILVSGSAAGILLEIDKFMIPQMELIASVAYYSVGIYIATVVAIPTRAMQQITSPITAQYLNDDNLEGVNNLYRQTSINLLVVGGLLFLLINLNIEDLYAIIDKPEFSQGIWIVLIISVAKLIELSLGTGNAILVNSKYFRVFFYLSLAMAVSVVLLNAWLIDTMGINGAALATLLVIAAYTLIKFLFIKSKFGTFPFSTKTLKVLLLIGLLFAGFSAIEINLSPLLGIAVKSVLICVIYAMFVKWLRISSDVDQLVRQVLTGMRLR